MPKIASVKRMVKVIVQSESSECALACLAMICSAHGQQWDLAELRRLLPISLKGSNLRQLMAQAATLGFSSRPMRLDIDELGQLQTPCILHWDLNHFVVLKKIARGGQIVVILDPAIGERRLRLGEVSPHFSGVALELTPVADFSRRAPAPKVTLGQLTGEVQGLNRSLLQIFALSLVLELFAIVAPLLNQMVVDDVLTSGDYDLLTVLVLGFGLLLLMQTAIGLARTWMVIVLGQTLALQWRGNVFSHLIRLPLVFFEKRHLGDITSRFGAISAIQRTLTTAAVEAMLDGLLAVVALVMMLIYAPALAALVLVAMALYGLLRWVCYAPFREAAAERMVMEARENSHFLETLRAMAPLKLFGREHERRARWQNLVVDVQNRDVRTSKLEMGFSTAKDFIVGAENLLVLLLGARMIMAGQTNGGAGMTVGMLLAFIAYKAQFTSRVSALIDYVVQLKMLSVHAERLADIALEPPETEVIPELDLAHLSASIELRNVSFRYADGEPWILNNASITIESGQSVAVTGPSGSGKTTLLKIALGLLQPSEGEVLYGGQRIQQLGLQNYRRMIGTVMQEDALLAGSLIENISFFDVQPDMHRVQVSAILAHLHDDIVSMPMGYQTLVGDLGNGLSGGQKQRLLLARALYKQPKVLALDEATSHLDLRKEREVSDSLASLPLTRLIIAHRPETIATAERVVELRGGQILEVAVDDLSTRTHGENP